MKAVIYARTSSPIVDDNHQVVAAKEFIDQNHFELQKVYADINFSAFDLNRPELKRLMLDAKNKEFDVIVTYSNDRLFRDSIELEKFNTELTSHGISCMVVMSR